jgi:hypothetical protein
VDAGNQSNHYRLQPAISHYGFCEWQAEMTSSSCIAFWTMLAAWAQVIVLVVTARFVWLYLGETEGLRETAQKQMAVSQDQLEGQIRPAIVIQHNAQGNALVLLNVGKGPALLIRLSRTERGSAGKPGLELMTEVVGFIAPGGQPSPTPISTQGAGIYGLRGNSLQCEYKSLSGRTYWTIADFDKFDNDRLIATPLGELV